MRSVQSSRTVDAEIARSWLLVNGLRSELFESADRSRADQVILDLEDAVDPGAKDAAREIVADWLSSGHPAWVRINNRSRAFFPAHGALLGSLPGLFGVLLAKTEAAEHVPETFDRLGGKVKVLPLI